METFSILTNLRLETYLNADFSISSRRATSLEKIEESALHHVRDGRGGTGQAYSEADKGRTNLQEI